MSISLKKRRVHFIGIGGIGMSGIAELLLNLGHSVSGSDLSETDVVTRLRGLGAQVQIGHSSKIVEEFNPHVVVYSTAVSLKNPELLFAKENQIPIIRRAEMLGEIMRLKRGIAIAGSHGKTTTTGLTSLILKTAGMEPTVVIGGKFSAIGSNAAWGGGQWIVAEADESDGSFLRLSPEVAVVTNIDREHLDHYKNFEAAVGAFEDFIDRLPFYGKAILCSDCPNLRRLSQSINKVRVWYGFEKDKHPDFLISILSEGAQSEFELYRKKDDYEKVWMKLKISVPGRHNILNATASVLVAHELDIPHEAIQKALLDFQGVNRRFEKKGFWKTHCVIEDYAHHPTEIRATLQAGKSVYGDLKPLVIFQPHRYSRTRDQWEEFAKCFEWADLVITLPIYAASEAKEDWTRDFDGENFCNNIQGVKARFAGDLASALEIVRSHSLAKDAPIFVLGAGDIPKLIPMILESP